MLSISLLGNRRDVAVERDDVDDAGALQDRQALAGVEPGETVAGKQRPVDLLLAILPAAPARNGRKKGFEALAFELLADDLLVPGAGPDGVPRRRVVHRRSVHWPAAGWLGAAICFS